MFVHNLFFNVVSHIDETNRHRAMQMQYNKEHDITSKTIVKAIHKVGTVSQGNTIEEAVENLKEATELYLED